MKKFWEWMEKKTGIREQAWQACYGRNWRYFIIGFMQDYFITELNVSIGEDTNIFAKLSEDNPPSYDTLRYLQLKDLIIREHRRIEIKTRRIK